MNHPPLDQPLGALLRPPIHIGTEGSLGEAARRIRESGAAALAVMGSKGFEGGVCESSLLRALSEGRTSHDSVLTAIDDMPVLGIESSGAEGLQTLTKLNVPAAFVEDAHGRIVGVITPIDLYGLRRRPNRPHVVGGMATPFGVYLTTGAFGAGAPPWALITTGMLLSSLMLAGSFVAFKSADLLADWPGVPAFLPDLARTLVAVLVLAAGMRLLPIAGIHAAEHQVVNAIESGEELTLETVRRMSRIHPRCGTNLAVALAIYTTVGTSDFLPDPFTRLIAAAIVTAATWRPLGTLAQRFITTKPANDKQLMMGIRSGEMLLQRYQSMPNRSPNIGQRLWNSGLPWVVVGTVICFGVAALIFSLTGQFDLLKVSFG